MIQPEAFHATLGDSLIGLRYSIDQLELEFSQLGAEFARGDEWDRDGFNNPSDWMRFNCNMTSHQVWNSITVGEEQAELEESVQALRSGEIGYAHLAVMARTAEAVGKSFDETKLLALASENSPGKFYFKCLHYRHSVDARAYAREQADDALNHHLSLSTAESGHVLINGVLDPVGGAAVRNALEPLARPSGEHDDRLLPQRYADALVELACGGRPANLQVTATIETLKGLAGAGGGEMDLSLPTPPAQPRRGDPRRCAAHGLRLQRDSGLAQPGVADHRRRALQANRQRRAAQGAWPTRQALQVAGLRETGFLV